MRMKIIVPFLAIALGFSSANLRGQEQIAMNEVSEQPQESAETISPTLSSQDINNSSEPREVGAASTEGARAAKKRQWQNIAIAGLAVAVAATAIYLASTNGGHND